MSRNLRQFPSLASVSDEEILKRSIVEPGIFEELVNRYRRPFARKALSILKNEDDAADAVQEAFVRIYAAAKKFTKKSGATFSSWAYTVLINQCYTAYKKRQRVETVSFDVEPALADMVPEPSFLDTSEKASMREQAMMMVSRLPELLRRAVTLHFLNGTPQKEIARLEGVSPGVIRARIHRAKKELRKLTAIYS